MRSDRLRTIAYTTIADLPEGKWFSFGELCQRTRIRPAVLYAFLRELKRTNMLAYRAYTTGNRFGGSVWRSFWMRTVHMKVET